MAGARLFGSFWGACQKELAVRAKPLDQPMKVQRMYANPKDSRSLAAKAAPTKSSSARDAEYTAKAEDE